MIDTDKYEGQTEGLWMMDKLGEIWRADGPEPYCILSVYHKPPIKPSEADLLLMADAPLLLAEVKRLRGIIAGIVTDMDDDWRFWRNELKKVIE